MHKHILLLSVLLLALLAACNGGAAAPTDTPTPVEAPTAAPTPTSGGTGPAVCVADPVPTESNIPPVTDEDWVRGPADAEITLIEYSDFQ